MAPAPPSGNRLQPPARAGVRGGSRRLRQATVPDCSGVPAQRHPAGDGGWRGDVRSHSVAGARTSVPVAVSTVLLGLAAVPMSCAIPDYLGNLRRRTVAVVPRQQRRDARDRAIAPPPAPARKNNSDSGILASPALVTGNVKPAFGSRPDGPGPKGSPKQLWVGAAAGYGPSRQSRQGVSPADTIPLRSSPIRSSARRPLPCEHPRRDQYGDGQERHRTECRPPARQDRHRQRH